MAGRFVSPYLISDITVIRMEVGLLVKLRVLVKLLYLCSASLILCLLKIFGLQ